LIKKCKVTRTATEKLEGLPVGDGPNCQAKCCRYLQ